MIEFKELTIIVPSLLSNFNQRWIEQVNRFNQNKINIIISIPPNFSKSNKIINKYVKGILIISSDDDIFISIKNLKILLNQFENLPRKSSIGPRLIIKKDNRKKLFFKKYINLLLYGNSKPRSGTISKSTFEVSHNFSIDSNKAIESVDYIPGGLSLIRKENIITKQYFIFEGKAYCEDLIYSNLLKNNGVKLFISNKSFYKTELQNYKDLSIHDFIEFIKNDFQARNYFRKDIRNPLLPFLIAYCVLTVNYFLRKIILKFFHFKKFFR